jgi:hypothetical protein
MFLLPDSTKVDKRIPKETIYKKSGVDNKTKELFIEQIKNIYWIHKISKDTMNIDKDEDVEELQIFEVKLKTENISERVIQIIDRNIPYPILFFITYENKYMLKIAYKEKNKNNENNAVVDTYYETDWQGITDEKINIIKGSNTRTIYENIIKDLLPIIYKDITDIRKLIKLNNEYYDLKKQIEKLKRKIKKEKQYNKKVEYNMKLHKLEEKLKNMEIRR